MPLAGTRNERLVLAVLATLMALALLVLIWS